MGIVTIGIFLLVAYNVLCALIVGAAHITAAVKRRL